MPAFYNVPKTMTLNYEQELLLNALHHDKRGGFLYLGKSYFVTNENGDKVEKKRDYQDGTSGYLVSSLHEQYASLDAAKKRIEKCDFAKESLALSVNSVRRRSTRIEWKTKEERIEEERNEKRSNLPKIFNYETLVVGLSLPKVYAPKRMAKILHNTMEALERAYEDYALPTPTLALRQGLNLYLLYCLKNSVSAVAEQKQDRWSEYGYECADKEYQKYNGVVGEEPKPFWLGLKDSCIKQPNNAEKYFFDTLEKLHLKYAEVLKNFGGKDDKTLIVDSWSAYPYVMLPVPGAKTLANSALTGEKEECHIIGIHRDESGELKYYTLKELRTKRAHRHDDRPEYEEELVVLPYLNPRIEKITKIRDMRIKNETLTWDHALTMCKIVYSALRETHGNVNADKKMEEFINGFPRNYFWESEKSADCIERLLWATKENVVKKGKYAGLIGAYPWSDKRIIEALHLTGEELKATGLGKTYLEAVERAERQKEKAKRDRRILHSVLYSGKSYKRIAAENGVSEKTVYRKAAEANLGRYTGTATEVPKTEKKKKEKVTKQEKEKKPSGMITYPLPDPKAEIPQEEHPKRPIIGEPKELRGKDPYIDFLYWHGITDTKFRQFVFKVWPLLTDMYTIEEFAEHYEDLNKRELKHRALLKTWGITQDAYIKMEWENLSSPKIKTYQDYYRVSENFFKDLEARYTALEDLDKMELAYKMVQDGWLPYGHEIPAFMDYGDGDKPIIGGRKVLPKKENNEMYKLIQALKTAFEDNFGITKEFSRLNLPYLLKKRFGIHIEHDTYHKRLRGWDHDKGKLEEPTNEELWELDHLKDFKEKYCYSWRPLTDTEKEIIEEFVNPFDDDEIFDATGNYVKKRYTVTSSDLDALADYFEAWRENPLVAHEGTDELQKKMVRYYQRHQMYDECERFHRDSYFDRHDYEDDLRKLELYREERVEMRKTYSIWANRVSLEEFPFFWKHPLDRGKYLTGSKSMHSLIFRRLKDNQDTADAMQQMWEDNPFPDLKCRSKIFDPFKRKWVWQEAAW